MGGHALTSHDDDISLLRYALVVTSNDSALLHCCRSRQVPVLELPQQQQQQSLGIPIHAPPQHVETLLRYSMEQQPPGDTSSSSRSLIDYWKQSLALAPRLLDVDWNRTTTTVAHHHDHLDPHRLPPHHTIQVLVVHPQACLERPRELFDLVLWGVKHGIPTVRTTTKPGLLLSTLPDAHELRAQLWREGKWDELLVAPVPRPSRVHLVKDVVQHMTRLPKKEKRKRKADLWPMVRQNVIALALEAGTSMETLDDQWHLLRCALIVGPPPAGATMEPNTNKEQLSKWCKDRGIPLLLPPEGMRQLKDRRFPIAIARDAHPEHIETALWYIAGSSNSFQQGVDMVRFWKLSVEYGPSLWRQHDEGFDRDPLQDELFQATHRVCQPSNLAKLSSWTDLVLVTRDLWTRKVRHLLKLTQKAIAQRTPVVLLLSPPDKAFGGGMLWTVSSAPELRDKYWKRYFGKFEHQVVVDLTADEPAEDETSEEEYEPPIVAFQMPYDPARPTKKPRTELVEEVARDGDAIEARDGDVMEDSPTSVCDQYAEPPAFDQKEERTEPTKVDRAETVVDARVLAYQAEEELQLETALLDSIRLRLETPVVDEVSKLHARLETAKDQYESLALAQSEQMAHRETIASRLIELREKLLRDDPAGNENTGDTVEALRQVEEALANSPEEGEVDETVGYADVSEPGLSNDAEVPAESPLVWEPAEFRQARWSNRGRLKLFLPAVQTRDDLLAILNSSVREVLVADRVDPSGHHRRLSIYHTILGPLTAGTMLQFDDDSIKADIPLCPFELSGSCCNKLCPFQHMSRPLLARELVPLREAIFSKDPASHNEKQDSSHGDQTSRGTEVPAVEHPVPDIDSDFVPLESDVEDAVEPVDDRLPYQSLVETIWWIPESEAACMEHVDLPGLLSADLSSQALSLESVFAFCGHAVDSIAFGVHRGHFEMFASVSASMASFGEQQGHGKHVRAVMNSTCDLISLMSRRLVHEMTTQPFDCLFGVQCLASCASYLHQCLHDAVSDDRDALPIKTQKSWQGIFSAFVVKIEQGTRKEAINLKELIHGLFISDANKSMYMPVDREASASFDRRCRALHLADIFLLYDCITSAIHRMVPCETFLHDAMGLLDDLHSQVSMNVSNRWDRFSRLRAVFTAGSVVLGIISAVQSVIQCPSKRDIPLVQVSAICSSIDSCLVLLRRLSRNMPLLELLLAPLFGANVALGCSPRKYTESFDRLVTQLANRDPTKNRLMPSSDLLWSMMVVFRICLPRSETSGEDGTPPSAPSWELPNDVKCGHEALADHIEELDVRLHFVTAFGDKFLVEAINESVASRDSCDALVEQSFYDDRQIDFDLANADFSFSSSQQSLVGVRPTLPVSLLVVGPRLRSLRLRSCSISSLPHFFGKYFPNLEVRHVMRGHCLGGPDSHATRHRPWTCRGTRCRHSRRRSPN